jgi:predicted Zn-dependent peptidase
VKTAFQVIDSYKRTGPAQGQAADARAALIRDLEANVASNSYLLNRILFKYEFGEDPREVFNMRPFYDQVTVTALRDAAAEYLNTNRYVEVTLIPESR